MKTLFMALLVSLFLSATSFAAEWTCVPSISCAIRASGAACEENEQIQLLFQDGSNGENIFLRVTGKKQGEVADNATFTVNYPFLDDTYDLKDGTRNFISTSSTFEETEVPIEGLSLFSLNEYSGEFAFTVKHYLVVKGVCK